ncbi:MAG: hypothetical protein ACTSWY_06820, partial [Promethearchaeota archaeon]
MKRKKSVIILTLFLVLSIFRSNLIMRNLKSDTILIKNNSIQCSATQTTQKNISIYVNSSVYSMIKSEISVYKSDLESDGFKVTIYNWSDPSPIMFFRAQNLKNHLNNSYNVNGTIGAVLIGNMPYVQYENASTYVTDLYFMDLNGLWEENSGNNIFDNHTNGGGDVHPEIFIGRINPYIINVPNCTKTLTDYFHRNHLYRTNKLTVYNSSLMYIDDTWESYSNEWKGDMLYLYSNITLINNTVEETNATNYLKEIVKPYDFCHAFIHSNETQHFFEHHSNYLPSNYVTNTQINNTDNNALFYNLYCCYAANFTTMDNIASHYLFSSNFSLAIFGSTRTGGFQLNQY